MVDEGWTTRGGRRWEAVGRQVQNAVGWKRGANQAAA